MKNYSKETTKSLKFLLWANLQDNLARGDKLDRCKDPEQKKPILQNIKETEKEISAIREELAKRQ